MTALAIRSVGQDGLPAFFAYLEDHAADSGRDGTPLFRLAPPGETRLPDGMKASFTAGLAAPLGQAGWRRAWIAVDEAGAIAGHIDLRARPEPAAAHRALLGMGVHRDWRRQGLGLRLIDAAAAWAQQHQFAWIDLEVFSVNLPALSLYRHAGFRVVGEIAEMFRIDNEFLSYTLMSRALPPTMPLT